MPTRRSLLGGLAATLAAAQSRSKPNILVFMTDQETALLPGPAKLPNRQRLLAGAASFPNAFCNTPQCSPARSSLLTGLEPHHTGVRTNVDGNSLGTGLPPGMANVGNVFRNAGWNTGYFGKWHLGGQRDGLDRFGFSVSQADSKDEATAGAASAWIRQQKQPWLAWVSVLNPHDIYQIRETVMNTAIRPGVRPPAGGLADLKNRPSEQQQFVDEDQGKITADFDEDHWLRYRSYYLNLLESTDVLLGRVLDAAGDLSNTIAVYTADHGDQLGDHGLPFKGPFLYEPLIRIPFHVRAPGRMAASVRDELVTQADLAPTLAALAGVTWPGKLDGQSLVQSIERDAVFLEYYAKQKWINPIRSMRGREWKFNLYQSGHRELYNLRTDPKELREVSKVEANQPMIRDFEARLDRWWRPAD